MGHRNADRVSIIERRSKGETVTGMLAERWDVITKCLRCGLIMQADLAMIARVSGPETSLWNRRPRCRKLGCGGRVQFQAKAPGMQWHEALETPDAREP
jgi:hypothetical protein